MNQHRTRYADDALEVQNGTEPEDIRTFVKRRAMSPQRINGLLVWNFNNHLVNESALAADASDFLYDEYVVPFSASGVWAYMTKLLPPRIREAEVLTYSQAQGEYRPFPNYFRHAEHEEDDALRTEIQEQLDQENI